MSEFTRRDLVKIALAVTTAGGSIDVASAQHVHETAAADKAATGGVYKPKAFTDHEYVTLRKLAELIVPADDVSPSALESGASEFIDLLCSNNVELASTYTGGIAWLDREMMRRYHANSSLLSRNNRPTCSTCSRFARTPLNRLNWDRASTFSIGSA